MNLKTLEKYRSKITSILFKLPALKKLIDLNKIMFIYIGGSWAFDCEDEDSDLDVIIITKDFEALDYSSAKNGLYFMIDEKYFHFYINDFSSVLLENSYKWLIEKENLFKSALSTEPVDSVALGWCAILSTKDNQDLIIYENKQYEEEINNLLNTSKKLYYSACLNYFKSIYAKNELINLLLKEKNNKIKQKNFYKIMYLFDYVRNKNLNIDLYKKYKKEVIESDKYDSITKNYIDELYEYNFN